jgi:hypothetical protein
MKKLLLHCCCAPCSTSVVEKLSADYKITMFFYNPNIIPSEEYEKRLSHQRRLALIYDMELIEDEYNHAPFINASCEKCIELRIKKTAETAVKSVFDCFTTTLSVSPHKNYMLISKILTDKGEKYGIEPICIDFKKQDGFKRSVELSKQYGLYRQNYCGCKLK